VSKKYNPLKDEIFLPIPLKIAQRKDLKNLSKIVYGYLLKCFGTDGVVNPSIKAIAGALGVTDRTIRKSLKELKDNNLIKSTRTGKSNNYEFIRIEDRPTVVPSDRPTVVPSDRPTVVPSDRPTVVPSLLLKEKRKEKIKKSGAAPDSFNNFHPYLDEIMRTMPDILKGQLSRPFVNKCLWDKNGDRPYIYWLFEKCADKTDPAGWVAGGMINYYAGYLK
jgi:hypothetical protein